MSLLLFLHQVCFIVLHMLSVDWPWSSRYNFGLVWLHSLDVPRPKNLLPIEDPLVSR